MRLLISVIPQTPDHHVYVNLVNQEDSTVIILAVYARKSLSQWKETKEDVLVPIERIDALVSTLNKARQQGISRGLWNENDQQVGLK